jgi:hypothetical protein
VHEVDDEVEIVRYNVPPTRDARQAVELRAKMTQDNGFSFRFVELDGGGKFR